MNLQDGENLIKVLKGRNESKKNKMENLKCKKVQNKTRRKDITFRTELYKVLEILEKKFFYLLLLRFSPLSAYFAI